MRKIAALLVGPLLLAACAQPSPQVVYLTSPPVVIVVTAKPEPVTATRPPTAVPPPTRTPAPTRTPTETPDPQLQTATAKEAEVAETAEAKAQRQTATAAVAARLQAPKREGSYLVAIDIAPGIWRSSANGTGDCALTILTLAGDLVDITYTAPGATIRIPNGEYQVQIKDVTNTCTWTYLKP